MPLDPNRKQQLLSTPINKLGLQIPGGRLEKLINQLYAELEAAGVVIKPECYLSDEWGCPHGIPIIGIPFYLATQEISDLEGEMTHIEAETDEEIMKYLRHEAGHAFNYAYHLYEKPEWRVFFGTFTKPYREEYRPKLFDPRFVRHLPGWYAQKHPDEDFAETFAVVITQNSNWNTAYAKSPAFEKLQYVQKLITEHKTATPIAFEKVYDYPVDELTETLGEWYRDIEEQTYKIILHPLIVEDLKMIFSQAPDGKAAADFIQESYSQVIHMIHLWTGKNTTFIEEAVKAIIKKLQETNLTVREGDEKNTSINFTAFMTTLIINHLQTEESFML